MNSVFSFWITWAVFLSPDISDWRGVDLPHSWIIELARAEQNVSGDSGDIFQIDGFNMGETNAR